MTVLREFVTDLRDWLGRRVYSQEGEDLILERYFGDRPPGFFVDVGAHHPWRFSNTYRLYRRGWRGVNIDAMPGSMRKFRTYRPRDINIETAIGSVRDTARFFVFNEPALNTFDAELAAARQVAPWRLVRTVDLPVRPLGEVLAEAISADQSIDLLSVDVEGRDLDVLKSNDWVRFRPRIVVAETLGKELADTTHEPVAQYLESLGYAVAAKTLNSLFLIDKSR